MAATEMRSRRVVTMGKGRLGAITAGAGEGGVGGADKSGATSSVSGTGNGLPESLGIDQVSQVSLGDVKRV